MHHEGWERHYTLEERWQRKRGDSAYVLGIRRRQGEHWHAAVLIPLLSLVYRHGFLAISTDELAMIALPDQVQLGQSVLLPLRVIDERNAHARVALASVTGLRNTQRGQEKTGRRRDGAGQHTAYRPRQTHLRPGLEFLATTAYSSSGKSDCHKQFVHDLHVTAAISERRKAFLASATQPTGSQAAVELLLLAVLLVGHGGARQ